MWRDVLDAAGAGHDDELAADDAVKFDHVGKVLRRERLCSVVRGGAADSRVVEDLPDLLCVVGRPVEVGRIEFDDFVAHFRDGPDGAGEVLLELVPDRI